MTLGVRTLPGTPALHMWTFGRQLNMRFTHNASHTPAEVIDAYMRHVVEIVTRIGVRGEEQ